MLALSAPEHKSRSLTPAALRTEWGKLSDYNQLVAQHILLVQLTAYDVERLSVMNRRRVLQLGDLGLFCHSCATAGTLIIGSISFPDHSNGNIAHHAYNLATRHLCDKGKCPHISSDSRNALMAATKSTTSQSMAKNRLGFPSYLKMVLEHYGISIIAASSASSSNDAPGRQMTTI